MMSDIDKVKYYFNKCNPNFPIPVEDPNNFYIDFDRFGLRGERCIDSLAATIRLSDSPTTQLFTGFPGAGKTSELFRLSKRLSDFGYLVVYADCSETIDILNPIEYSEVLIALGLVVDERLANLKKEGQVSRWARRFGREIKELLFSDIALQQFKLKVGKVPVATDIGFELKKNPSFRGALRQAANDRRRQFLDQIRTFFYDADKAARKMGSEKGLVVILDNLEKLSTDADTRDSARNMLLHHSDALRQPGIHLVYTVPAPFVFSVWGPQLGRIYDGEPLVLPMVKIRDRRSGKKDKEGTGAMRRLLLRRVDFEEVFAGDEDTLSTLINYCGGYTRDLLRLFQYSLQNAWGFPVKKEHVDMAVSKLERSYKRGFTTDELPLLQYVSEHRPESISEDFRNRLEQVMVNHYVMIYGNDTEWYDLHPIVRKFIQQAETLSAGDKAQI
jgi:hypothetical protein